MIQVRIPAEIRFQGVQDFCQSPTTSHPPFGRPQICICRADRKMFQEVADSGLAAFSASFCVFILIKLSSSQSTAMLST